MFCNLISQKNLHFMDRDEKPASWRARNKAWLQAPILTIFLKDHITSWKYVYWNLNSVRSWVPLALNTVSVSPRKVGLSWGGKKKQMGNEIVNQINFFVCVLFPYKPIMLSCSCKGYNEKIKNIVGLLSLRNPGGSVSKTNKPLQVRTPDFETERKMIAKMLLYQNEYVSNSKCMIFNTKWMGK